MGAVFAIVLSLLAIFLILLVLVQRGRGGGLAGALGGMGGSSAFGAKAGDVFTRITIIVASIWIAFCLLALFWAKHRGDVLNTAAPISSSSTDTNPLTSKSMPPTGPAAPGDSKNAATSGTAANPANPPSATTAAPPAEAPAATPPAAAESPAGPAGDATNKEAPPGK
jgi:preprotein translocase subunit SecG